MTIAARLFLLVGFLVAPMFGSADTAQAQIVAIGASNVAGRGVSSSDAWPAQLEGMLAAKGRHVHVTNAGIYRRYQCGNAGPARFRGPPGNEGRAARSLRRRLERAAAR